MVGLCPDCRLGASGGGDSHHMAVDRAWLEGLLVQEMRSRWDFLPDRPDDADHHLHSITYTSTSQHYAAWTVLKAWLCCT